MYRFTFYRVTDEQEKFVKCWSLFTLESNQLFNAISHIFPWKKLTKFHQVKNERWFCNWLLPATWTFCLGSMTPEFGFTQYRLGAVVLILKHSFRSVGFLRLITADTAVVKGPTNVSSCWGSIIRTCSGLAMMTKRSKVRLWSSKHL